MRNKYKITIKRPCDLKAAAFELKIPELHALNHKHIKLLSLINRTVNHAALNNNHHYF